MVKSKTHYQDIAKKFETAAKGKKTEKQLLRLQNSLQMVPQFRDWTKTFQDLLTTPENEITTEHTFFFIPEQ